MDFLVNRDDLHDCRVVDSEVPAIEEGQALLAVETFGLTANNITYAVFGDAMNYWDFFPTGVEGWGHVPMWGFATVADPGSTGLEAGARVFGYLPPASHLVATPERLDERGFSDGAAHRKPLPAAYQAYRLTAGDPVYAAGQEAELMIFWPLFYTSFLLDDFLADEGFFGAKTIVVSSASSKTAAIAAQLLAQRQGIELVGLTSPGNVEFVESLGVYDATVTYDEIGGLDREPAVYTDFSGDAGVRTAVHEHFGDELAHDAAIGITHWGEMASGSAELPGPAPTMFFAPNRIKKRREDWGGAGLDKRVADAWKPFVEWSAGWLDVQRAEGSDALRDTYLEVLEGKIDPKAGHVLSFPD
jgi:NADPH:quinone reductase-like Zn-dependent oxidoreductase